MGTEVLRRSSSEWRKMPVEERFLAHIELPLFGEKCCEWKGALVGKGYGQMCVEGKKVYAHRLAYELHIGVIPDGFTIDHLCRNRRCVNPLHLEAVTMRENNLRGNSKAAQHARKTHCVRGHLLAGENLYVVQGPHGEQRNCRACRKAYSKEYEKTRVRDRRKV